MCGDSERTVTLTHLQFIWKSCPFAELQDARQRARRAISINSSYFVFLASPGVSMVTFYTVKRRGKKWEKKSVLSLSQATCCSRCGPNVSHRSAGRCSACRSGLGMISQIGKSHFYSAIPSATSFDTQLHVFAST